jgi:hypothetical protein
MSVGLSNQKEVPTVESFTIEVTAARLGADCLAARSPWTNVVVLMADTGANHALGLSHAPAAGSVDARRGAFRPTPVQQTAQMAQQTQSALWTDAELLPMTDTVTFTRKPNNVHKTRISAGGYGAMGPHPEREPLA